MIRFYNYPLSPCGEKVRYVLLEKRLSFEEITIDLATKQNLKPEFLSVNPSGLVPVVQNGRDTVVESTVIMEYLEDAFPARPLRPVRPSERAEMRLWTKRIDEVLHPVWPALAWPVLIRPRWLEKTAAEIDALLAAMPNAAKRERQRSMLALGAEAPEYTASLEVLSNTLDLMEARLAENDWLAGATLSLADYAVLPYVFVANLFGLGDWAFTQRPACAAWYGKLARRSAFGGDLERIYPVALIDDVSRSAAHLFKTSP